MSEVSYTAKGHYLGTEIDETWWRRYRRDHLFARGNGRYHIDRQGLHFKRYFLTPFSIPFTQVRMVKLGKWHAGRWAGGRPVVKLCWEHRGEHLCSGFVLTRDWAVAEELQQRLNTLLRQRREETTHD
ncbi:MAG: hypothetical protein AB1810_01565 [Pseudomonadota bacterium]